MIEKINLITTENCLKWLNGSNGILRLNITSIKMTKTTDIKNSTGFDLFEIHLLIYTHCE